MGLLLSYQAAMHRVLIGIECQLLHEVDDDGDGGELQLSEDEAEAEGGGVQGGGGGGGGAGEEGVGAEGDAAAVARAAAAARAAERRLAARIERAYERADAARFAPLAARLARDGGERVSPETLRARCGGPGSQYADYAIAVSEALGRICERTSDFAMMDEAEDDHAYEDALAAATKRLSEGRVSAAELKHPKKLEVLILSVAHKIVCRARPGKKPAGTKVAGVKRKGGGESA